MRIILAGIGRLKAGAERELFDRYVDRARKAGRPLGLSGPDLIELPESRAPRAPERKAAEAAALLAALPPSARVIALDEGGRGMTSEQFAERLGAWRDAGTAELAFVIGGADGHGADLLARADLRLAFGAMTWPHQLVRVLLSEQVYRAVSILSGHPYHRR